MPEHSTEVFILTGFLGAGKSTLLTRLMQHELEVGRNIAVIMNELGEVSIDSSFIPKELPRKDLTDGCICCSLQGDLSAQIEQLLQEHRLDAIYIEATGAAQPFDILDACTDPTISGSIEVRAVITVVDAKQWDDMERLPPELSGLLLAQATHADVIVLTKTDALADPDRVPIVLAHLQSINPSAQIIASTRAGAAASAISSAERVAHAPVAAEPLHLHKHLHLNSFAFYPSGPLIRQAFEGWLGSLPGQLYRAKGFVRLAGEDGLFLFQHSYEQSIFTRFLVDVPYTPVLVFIGVGLNPAVRKSELRLLQASDETAGIGR
ncbi:CobW family GTP-binding protein [Paenibacillus xerothermodurans]|uniref:GTP-binding protein n=1 Tax=Paenibacillus xerothermodurans TaxID=1977292 RepID=A0A2W1NYU6_PAEXE|nr:GTP-binding protein [Paenibacillus xerothermodurans]PZE20018.1 GTP-binding protein [Paenibacillus xerothermodurans]